jgi:hypothetical protein
MWLRHATPMGNLPSIKRRGLDPKQSRGHQEVVWLHRPSRTAWALLHTQQRHHTSDVIVIDVNVPRSWVQRRRCGLWTCRRTIEPHRLSRWYAIDELIAEEQAVVRPSVVDDDGCAC